ncbi:MAG: hypothetical protein U0412_10665 [Nitrospira sp.]
MDLAQPVLQTQEESGQRPRQNPVARHSQGQDSDDDGISLPAKLLGITTACLVVWIGYKIAIGKYYTPRSNFGFYLGVVGSVMMLALLLYPIRKHVRFMQRWGALKHWFRWHMVMGILGPGLIVFHSAFQLRSLNATVALVSMLIVVASGVIGRFVYTKIHYGLYGSRATLAALQEECRSSSGAIQSRLHFVPEVESWLAAFGRQATQSDRSVLIMWWQAIMLGWIRRYYEIRCAFALRRALAGTRRPEFPHGASQAVHLISRYLRQAERVAEFHTYERVFSLWHILHIPLIYLLAASAVFHVVAVYMY